MAFDRLLLKGLLTYLTQLDVEDFLLTCNVVTTKPNRHTHIQPIHWTTSSNKHEALHFTRIKHHALMRSEYKITIFIKI